MTDRSKTRIPSRIKNSRTTADTLFQKPLSDWFAEWKAKKALTPAPCRSPRQQSSTTPTSS
jgi:hypothetical protein